MRTCGIDLKGNEAILVCLEGSNDDYHQIGGEIKKIRLGDLTDQSAVRSFFKKLETHIEKIGCERIGIKERATKGKFAGGPASFKMEGLIQLLNCPVEIIHGRTLQTKLKGDFLDSAGYNQYQMEALRIAYYLMKE